MTFDVVRIVYDGIEHTAAMALHDDGVSVWHPQLGQKFAVLHNSPAHTLAGLMLRELIEHPST